MVVIRTGIWVPAECVFCAVPCVVPGAVPCVVPGAVPCVVPGAVPEGTPVDAAGVFPPTEARDAVDIPIFVAAVFAN